MRTIRKNIPGTVYHLIPRFVEERWFLAGPQERDLYLRLFARALADSDWRCISYALMSSHIHLGMVAGELPLEHWSKRVHTPFAEAINQQHGRIGPVFTRGPRDYAVPPARVADLIAYIHNNPVRAGVVPGAAESTWTSHRSYLGLESRAWLHVDEGLARSGLDANRLASLVETDPDDPTRIELRGVRRAISRSGQVEVGTTCDGRLPLLVRPHAIVRPDPRWFVDVTAAAFGLTSSQLCSRRRDATVSTARRVAVHAGLAFGLVGADIGAALGISSPAVTRIRYQGIEDQRRVYDAVVARLRQLIGSEDRPRRLPSF